MQAMLQALEQARLHLGVGIPEQQGQGIEQAFAWITIREGIARRFRSESFDAQQVITPGIGVGAFFELANRVIPGRGKPGVQPPVLEPEPHLESESRQRIMLAPEFGDGIAYAPRVQLEVDSALVVLAD